MTLLQWFIFFLLIQVIHFLGTWKLYQKAGRQAWEALVPVYNAIILMKIINRPKWWAILLFIPVVNLVMFPVIWVETARSFGRHSSADTWLSILTLGFYLYYLNYAVEVEHIHDRSLKPRTVVGEWVSAILFAVVAATIVHNYFIQPFTIPTPSLEKTLLVGDFLFVSKINYGARAPETTLAAPMVHDTIPKLGIKSYTNWPKLPYLRFPGFEKIKHNDIVVFNWPVDTVPYFGYKGNKSFYKPVDKKSNYVKRAVGLPGDSLSIDDGDIMINGKVLELPERAKPQTSYLVKTKGDAFNPRYLYEQFDYTEKVYPQGKNLYLFVSLTEKTAKKLENNPNVSSIEKIIAPKGQDGGTFPKSDDLHWNGDNYGPIYIPKKGDHVAINKNSIPFYKRIIEVYEGIEMGEEQKITYKGDQVLMNGKPLDNYTFKQDYYWMIGDNRHNSEDSRYWGYVPETHIVGKPVFIWMSIDKNGKGLMNRIRWDRVFTTINGKGEPTSFLPYFLIGVVVLIGVSVFRKRKKKDD